MAAKSFSELKAAIAALPAVSVGVQGLDDEVLVHQFTWAQFDKLMNLKGDDSFAKQAICMLCGSETLESVDDIGKEDIEALMATFTVAQVREIYQKCMRINGFGAEAVRDAEKNLERTQA